MAGLVRPLLLAFDAGEEYQGVSLPAIITHELSCGIRDISVRMHVSMPRCVSCA